MATYVVETVTIGQPTQRREIAVTAATADEAMQNARLSHYATFGWGPEARARIVDPIES